ncbi:Plasmodium vivax Vir protein, putative [Plasmodium vivax]|uniref:Vir protein, putative n=1 Tax=Plasmodium vivax TaxID=5855 RepID=A0A1G4E929_PLAVI|nr:Plasmodium vivax Vir protein, putative [Plasmodium vivax]
MTEPISVNDLPSVKFEKEINDLMNYSTFKTYEKNKTKEGEIDHWIEDFQEKLGAYSSDSSDNFSLNNNKHCKHFNYLINITISELHSLTGNIIEGFLWSDKIKQSRDKFFSSNNLNCNEDYKYSDEDDKLLGTFCEDSDFIMKKKAQIQYSDHCQNIVDYMYTRKVNLIKVRDRGKRGGIFPKIDDICSTEFLDTIFPSITCNSTVERQTQVDEPALSDELDVRENSSDDLVIQSIPVAGDLKTDRHRLVTTPEESETEERTSSNTLNLVALPILGALGCSFLLYKFTPVGSLFRPRIQNKGIVPINKDGYSTKQISSNIHNTNDTYSENTQYNISYQRL